MRVVPLGAHSSRAVRDLLVAHGWEAARAQDAAGGLESTAVFIEGLEFQELEALVAQAGQLGLELLTGSNWALLSGSASRMGSLARPWVVPPALATLAAALGPALPPAPPASWALRGQPLSLAQPVIVGILNVTPDSFSDAGLAHDPGAAVARAEAMVAAGAGMIDVGGESTRPGRESIVSPDEEAARVVPVISALVRRLPQVSLSVDTMKATVARAALDAGAHAVNDVTAGRYDGALLTAAAEAGAGVVLMHSRGQPLEIASYTHATYDDVVGDVMGELAAARDLALDAGIAADAIVLDPGFGFSKTVAQNILLADRLGALGALGHPVMVGPSRKRFLGQLTGRAVGERDTATAACCALCLERGAVLFRVHDVGAVKDALRVALAFGGSVPDA